MTSPTDTVPLHQHVRLRPPRHQVHPRAVTWWRLQDGIGYGVLLLVGIGVLVFVTVRTLRARARHRNLLDLLGTPWPAAPHARVLDHPLPVAYCLPGEPAHAGPRVQICVTAPDVPASTRIFDALKDGGDVVAPLAPIYFSPAYGIVRDRYGVTFQIFTERPAN